MHILNRIQYQKLPPHQDQDEQSQRNNNNNNNRSQKSRSYLIALYLITIPILTTSLVLTAVLYTWHRDVQPYPLSSPSSPYNRNNSSNNNHNHSHNHPQEKQNKQQHSSNPITPKYTNCGTSPEEARSRNCSFDILSFAWQTPECYDGELMRDFVEYMRENWGGDLVFYVRPDDDIFIDSNQDGNIDNTDLDTDTGTGADTETINNNTKTEGNTKGDTDNNNTKDGDTNNTTTEKEEEKEKEREAKEKPTIPLEAALQGSISPLFVNWRFHVVHCTFMYRQLHRAYHHHHNHHHSPYPSHHYPSTVVTPGKDDEDNKTDENGREGEKQKGYIDSHLDAYAHTLHCQRALLDDTIPMGRVSVVAEVKYPECLEIGGVEWASRGRGLG